MATDIAGQLSIPLSLLLLMHSVVPRSRFLGDTGVPLFEFLGDIYKFWGKYHIIKNFTCKLNSYPEFSVHFLFKVELDVNSFGLRWGVDGIV